MPVEIVTHPVDKSKIPQVFVLFFYCIMVFLCSDRRHFTLNNEWQLAEQYENATLGTTFSILDIECRILYCLAVSL
jgi:hypothetical protein